MQQVLSSSWDGWPFGHNGHGRKLGGCAPFGTGAGSHVKQCGQGRDLPLYKVASWCIQLFGHNRHGTKFGGAGSASNTMLSELRPTIIPCGILIHPAIWPQQTWAENRGGAVPLFGKGAGSPSNTVARAEAYLHAKLHLDLSNCLATIHQSYRQTGQ